MTQRLHVDLPLRTERLVLRAHRADDLDDLVVFHSDPDVVRWTPWPVRDRAATQAALDLKLDRVALEEPGQWLVLAIELARSGTVIGEVLLKWSADRQGELGFALGREHHGQGLASEAATAVLRLAFDGLGFHRVTAVCVDANHDSARLLRRLGFRQEGTLVDGALLKGEWVTQLLFALLEDEWRATLGGDPLRDG